MRRLFELMEVTPEHVLVVVTHTALFTDEVQGAYSDALHGQLGGEVVSRENIVHANFAQGTELRQAREPSPISASPQSHRTRSPFVSEAVVSRTMNRAAAALLLHAPPGRRPHGVRAAVVTTRSERAV